MIPDRRLLAISSLFVLLTASATAQRRIARGGTGMRSGAGAPPSDIVQTAVVHFEGILRNFDKKNVLLDREDGQTLVFRRTKTTAFLPAGDHSGLSLGIKVQIEAHRDRVGDLDAIRVCENICTTK